MNTTVYILVGGLLFGMVAGQVSDGLFNRAAAALSPQVRETIYQRESKLAGLMRMLDGFALFIMVVGIIKITGNFPLKTPGISWGYYAMAAGNIFGGLSMTWFGFQRKQIYTSMPEAEVSHAKATQAFLSVLLFEVLWVAAIAYMAVMYFPPLFDKAKTTKPNTPTVNAPAEGENPPPETVQSIPVPPKVWVEKEEALKILGVDAEHLELLAKTKEIRTKKTPEGLLFHQNDLSSLKQVTIPTKTELQERLKEQPAEEPQAKEPKPPTDRKPLQE